MGANSKTSDKTYDCTGWYCFVVNALSIFFLPMRVCSIFSRAGKFFLAHGLRQLTCDIKSDIRILNFGSAVLVCYHEKHRMMLVDGRYAM